MLCFGIENVQLLYMYCDSFVLSCKTEDFIKDLSNLEDLFDLSKLYKASILYSEKIKNKKVVGNLEIEIPENVELMSSCLRSKA